MCWSSRESPVAEEVRQIVTSPWRGIDKPFTGTITIEDKNGTDAVPGDIQTLEFIEDVLVMVHYQTKDTK